MKSLLLVLAMVLVGCASGPPKAVPSELIADPNVEAAIRNSVWAKPTGELTKADLEKVEKLDLGGYVKLTDLKSLENLTKLEELYLDNNQLTSVKGLEKLTQLRSLTIRRNQLTDLKGLEKLTQLKYLTLTSANLTNVKGLENLTQLTFLRLNNNQLTDVKGLEKLTKLTSLYLGNNKLTDVKGLKKLTKLIYLDLTFNPALTKAQIDELHKALTKCKLYHTAKK